MVTERSPVFPEPGWSNARPGQDVVPQLPQRDAAVVTTIDTSRVASPPADLDDAPEVPDAPMERLKAAGTTRAATAPKAAKAAKAAKKTRR